jgi:hypothetical protein
MPISPQNRKLYPPDWKAISERIRFERAKGQCECCGVWHGESGCRDVLGEFITSEEHAAGAGLFDSNNPLPKLIKIVLTVAHLNHDPTDNRDENLKAMCQKCHNDYDRAHRQANARVTREKKRNRMFGGEA